MSNKTSTHTIYLHTQEKDNTTSEDIENNNKTILKKNIPESPTDESPTDEQKAKKKQQEVEVSATGSGGGEPNEYQKLLLEIITVGYPPVPELTEEALSVDLSLVKDDITFTNFYKNLVQLYGEPANLPDTVYMGGRQSGSDTRTFDDILNMAKVISHFAQIPKKTQDPEIPPRPTLARPTRSDTMSSDGFPTPIITETPREPSGTPGAISPQPDEYYESLRKFAKEQGWSREKFDNIKKGIATDESPPDSVLIVKNRLILDKEGNTLYRQQQVLDKQKLSLKRKYEELYRTCKHPLDERSRTHGPYPQTEIWCPHCHREEIYG